MHFDNGAKIHSEHFCICCQDHFFMQHPVEFAPVHWLFSWGIVFSLASASPTAMEPKWQFKFVQSCCEDPAETSRLFATSTGWGTLGPMASQRCQAAWENPLPGVNFFMTLSPMISFRFHLVGHCSEGMTLCRLRTDLAACCRCIVKPIVPPIRVTVEVVPEGNGTCFLRFYSMAGDLKLVVQNKSMRSRWGPVLKDAARKMGRTNMDSRSVTFLTLNGVEISEQHHHDVIGEGLPLPVPGKKVKSKFTKK